MSPSATPATQTAAASTASTGNQARHQSQPSAIISATSATQSGGPCHQVPHLPRRMHARVAKYHACHANTGGVHAVNWSTGNQARHQSQPSAISATPAMQNARTCLQAPHLPRRMHVHVSKYHPCHANSGGVHAGNQPRHQSQPSAISATPATQNARTSCVRTSCV